MSEDQCSDSDHRLLLVTGHRWIDTSRLALGARQAGFAVHLLGPKDHPIATLPWVHADDRYSPVRPSRTIAHVLNMNSFDVVVPADDLGAAALFDVYLEGMLTEQAAQTIRRSLGDPGTFGIRHARAAVGDIATRAGLAAPATRPLTGEPLSEALVPIGFPAVLKADGSFGGQQVIIADDLDAASAAYATLSRPPRPANALGRLVLDHDATYIRPALARSKQAVSAQEFVPGEPATLSAIAWNGRLLDFVAVRAVRTRPGNGPATIVEPIAHPDMERAAREVAGRLGLSGLFGLDFIVSTDGSTASLIELNPRATPTSHLRPPSLRRPLFHLLADCVGVETPPPPPPLPEGPIALFPQAMSMDQDDADLTCAYLDYPGDEDVVDICRTARTGSPPAALDRMIRRIF